MGKLWGPGVQFLFGDHALDTDRRELRRGADQISLGPQVFDNALKLMNGVTVDKNQLTNESVFFPDKAQELLPTRKY